MLDIRKERRIEWVFENAVILLTMSILFVSYYFRIFEMVILFFLVSLIVVSVIRAVKPEWPKPFLKWQETLRAHEITYYGYAVWKNRKRWGHALLLVLVVILSFFIGPSMINPSNQSFYSNTILVEILVLYLMIFVLSRNIGHIVRKSYIDAFFGHDSKGFTLKGKTLCLGIAMLIVWVLFGVIIYFFFS
ncbi:hypothetical protein [Shouchella hunanensis]|uniref:Uncharacterized protein n=1 Tax=Shouchella hunanensis TaxID=766894 RepID=A0ABY7W2A2_9BACI|nr:hypothetical protein [Shouchella hunanensis]WDF02574.1 hypothetical protein PQ477_13745 [Shouchella hunanensis]